MPVSRHLVLATVTGFPDTQVVYPCCISCYSKLLKDQNQERWLCCKCGQSCRSDQVEWRYRLALIITDGETIATVCLFGSMLDQYFGSTATQFKRYLLGLESSCDYSDQVLKRAVERSFIGRSYYFGFKRTANINRHGPNAPITLRHFVDILEPKHQTSHENLSHIVAFQILSSTSTAQTTVMNLMVLDLQKESSHLTGKSPPQNLETKLAKKEEDNSVVKQHETKNDLSAISCDGFLSSEGHSNLTCTLSFLSVCTSSLGQETALLSCDMSNSVDNISHENLSKRQSTKTSDVKSHFYEFDSLGQVWTEPLSLESTSISPEVAPDNICKDKSSTTFSPLKIQESPESRELLKSRQNRLDSSGYTSLLKISANLEGNNSKETSLMDGSLNKCSWDKENFGDDKFDAGTGKENDPFSESLKNSSFSLTGGICATSTQPLLKLDGHNRRSVNILHPLSQENHIHSSKSSSKDISCPHSGCFKENFTTGDKIKDRFKKFTSSKNIRLRKKSHGEKHSLVSTRSFPYQQSMSCSVVAPVGNIKISKEFLMDSVTTGKDNISVTIPRRIIKNNNANIVFPESEDLWAYLTEEEEFGDAESISLGKVQNLLQSKGDNSVTENVKRMNSCEEDSDVTFEECFDAEFLNLGRDASDEEEDSDERASDSKGNVGKAGMHDTYEDNENGAMLNFNEDTYIKLNTHKCDEHGTKHSDKKINTSIHKSDEEIDEGMHDFVEDVDFASQFSEGENDSSSQNCHKEIDRRAFYSDEEIDDGTQETDNCDNTVPTGTHKFDGKVHTTAGMYGSHERLHAAETIGSVVAKINHTGNKTKSGIPNSRIALLTASSKSEKHVIDHCTTLINIKPDNSPEEGLEPLPESEGLYAFLDSTFEEVTEEKSLDVCSLRDKEGDREKAVEKEEICNVFDIKNGEFTTTQLLDDTNNDKIQRVSVGNDNLNCKGEAEYVKITNLKEDTEGNCVLPSSDETIEHLESMFDDSFDGEDTRNEDWVHSSQEIVKYPTHKSDHTTNKSPQSSSKSCQNASYSKKKKNCPMQNKATEKAVPGLIESLNENIHRESEDSISCKLCKDLDHQDSSSLSIQEGHNQNTQSHDQQCSTQLLQCQGVTGYPLLFGKDHEHPINENSLNQEQSSVSTGISFAFNSSTDLFSCLGNSNIALCNDTYSESLTCDDVQVAPNRSQVETAKIITDNVVMDNEQGKVKNVQFARRLSCVKSIQLIDIEMKIRQNPGLRFPAIPKSCLKIASPCSSPCLNVNSKKPKLSKIFNLKRQDRVESQDLFSCSEKTESSCDVLNQESDGHVSEDIEDVFTCNEVVNGIPGTQDLFTPSPVHLSDSMSSDFVLGSTSCNRQGTKLKFPTWTKKPLHCQTFASTPLNGYNGTLCSSENEVASQSQNSENSFANNSAPLFLDSFDELHVTNTSAHIVKNPSSLKDYSLSTLNHGKRKDSPVCVGFGNQIRGDNHTSPGEVTLDTGSPDLFGISNISADTTGSDRKIQTSTVAKYFTFPVKRLFLD